MTDLGQPLDVLDVEISCIPPHILAKIRQELGLGDKFLDTCTVEEKRQLVAHSHRLPPINRPDTSDLGPPMYVLLLDAEVSYIPPHILAELRQELGLGERDIDTFTVEEKQKLVAHSRRLLPISAPDPPDPIPGEEPFGEPGRSPLQYLEDLYGTLRWPSQVHSPLGGPLSGTPTAFSVNTPSALMDSSTPTTMRPPLLAPPLAGRRASAFAFEADFSADDVYTESAPTFLYEGFDPSILVADTSLTDFAAWFGIVYADE